MHAKPIPEGHRTVTPYLIVRGVEKLITFVEKTFSAIDIHRLDLPDGSIMHVEARIGDSIIMMGEPMDEFGPMPASIYVYVTATPCTKRRSMPAGPALWSPWT